MKDYKYLKFIEAALKPKTKVFEVRSKVSGELLGYVKWYAPWRRYCFIVDLPNTLFDASCLADIQDFINTLMTERRGEK